MPKSVLLSLKNRKNRPALGAPPQAPSGWGFQPQNHTLALLDDDFYFLT